MTYTTIYPSDRETAEALLAAAENLGLDPHEVRTVAGGFLVPDAVAARYEDMKAGKTDPISEEGPSDEEVPADVTYVDGTKPEVGEDGIPVVEAKTPDESWKNADIVAYAEENNIDLGDATKKADMLAAITADTKEE